MVEVYRRARFVCELINPAPCRSWTLALMHRDVDPGLLDARRPADRELLRNMSMNGWRHGYCDAYQAGQGCIRGELICRGHWVCPKHWGEDHGSIGRAVGPRAGDAPPAGS